MPIRAENRARYPRDWSSRIVPLIRARSGGRCECTGQCGLDHKGRCEARHGQPNPITGSIVVLTVMHLDHQPENNAPDNLLHGCQRCHNRYDAPMRRAGILARARAALKMKDLFE